MSKLPFVSFIYTRHRKSAQKNVTVDERYCNWEIFISTLLAAQMQRLWLYITKEKVTNGFISGMLHQPNKFISWMKSHTGRCTKPKLSYRASNNFQKSTNRTFHYKLLHTCYTDGVARHLNSLLEEDTKDIKQVLLYSFIKCSPYFFEKLSWLRLGFDDSLVNFDAISLITMIFTEDESNVINFAAFRYSSDLYVIEGVNDVKIAKA